MRRSVKGGSRLHKVGTHLAPAAIPVLAGLRCVLLRQPGSSGSCALFCAAAERCSSGCVVVVEEGIRGRAGRAQTAARCATSGFGPRQWPHRAAAWLPPRPSCRVRPAPVCSQSELTPFPRWSHPMRLGFSGSPETTGEAPHAALTCPTPPTGPIELVCPRWSHRLDVAPAPGGSEQPPETARRRPVICSGHGDANHARARRARDARLTG